MPMGGRQLSFPRPPVPRRARADSVANRTSRHQPRSEARAALAVPSASAGAEKYYDEVQPKRAPRAAPSCPLAMRATSLDHCVACPHIEVWMLGFDDPW